MDLLVGLLIGLFGAFFVFYSMQPQRPYPSYFLNIFYQPWMIVLILICIIALFTVNEQLAMVLFLILLFFMIDIYYLGRQADKNLSTL